MKARILTAAIISVFIAVASVSFVWAQTPTAADAHNCLPTSPDDQTCLWQLELTKVEVKVEYEYPYCEVKLVVENNLDELPDFAQRNTSYAERIFYSPPGEPKVTRSLHSSDWRLRQIRQALQHHSVRLDWDELPNAGKYDFRGQWVDIRRFSHKEPGKLQRFVSLFETLNSRWESLTLGSFHMQTRLSFESGSEYLEPFMRERRFGNALGNYSNRLRYTFISDPIPISHTFAGMTEELFACYEVAKRESVRVAERSALDTEKAGLRATLKLIEAELARARAHELDATNILKEVIEVSARVEELRRTIQRIRVEGLAERRALVARYYADEVQRYSILIKSLESSEAALAASDKAIAAHKAALEASRENLNKLVEDAQAAEAALIAEIEDTRKALGESESN